MKFIKEDPVIAIILLAMLSAFGSSIVMAFMDVHYKHLERMETIKHGNKSPLGYGGSPGHMTPNEVEELQEKAKN